MVLAENPVSQRYSPLQMALKTQDGLIFLQSYLPVKNEREMSARIAEWLFVEAQSAA